MRFLSNRLVLTVYTFWLFVVQASILPADEPREASVGNSKIDILVRMLEDPHASDSNLNQTNYAIKELGKLGPKAVPAVIDAILRKRTIGPDYAASALDAVGKRGVDAVRKRWDKLDDVQRWKLMRFRGQFDYDAALMFALASLDSKNEEVRREAIRYAGKHKETRAGHATLSDKAACPACPLYSCNLWRRIPGRHTAGYSAGAFCLRREKCYHFNEFCNAYAEAMVPDKPGDSFLTTIDPMHRPRGMERIRAKTARCGRGDSPSRLWARCLLRL